jgi:hypothetical protein
MMDLFTPNVLIACAAGAFAIGYLTINQMKLRMLMLIGSTFYIAYYATAAADPLYGGIFTTMGMMLTNLIGMAALTLRRFRISLPAAHTDSYPMFSMLPPGDFRLVMKHADRAILDADQTVTTEGDAVKRLYFILSGSAKFRKRGAQFDLPDGVFVGEVAYLLQRSSVATTTISAGAEVLRWDVDDMRQNIARNPRFKLAIDAMLSHDLARKVGEAVAPQMEPQVA